MPSTVLLCVCMQIFIGIAQSSGVEWDGFLGKFTNHFFANDGFFELPLTKSDALNSYPPYVDTHVQDPDFELDIFCLAGDPHVCMLFDMKGCIAGLRISHLKNEVSSKLSTFEYRYDNISMFKSSNLLGHDAWYANFLFANPENFQNNGPGRLSTEETAEGLWVKFDDGWKEIPRDECEAQRQGYLKQGFTRWMGNHYSKSQLDDCATYLPILPIYNKGSLIALSFAPLGLHTPMERDWFETVPSDVIPDVVPNGYEPCLQKWTRDYGMSSFHFYFINHPRWILFDRSKSSSC